jgi:hypothetical protein
MIRHGPLAFLLALTAAVPAHAADAVVAEDVSSIHYDNSIQPELSEEGRIFTGQDVKPLTPDNFSTRMDDAIAGAKGFASILGPEIWAILIAGFGLVGFVIRRSERVLKFDTEDASRRTTPPADPPGDSAPDASTPPHSDSDPAPSARRDQAE